MLISYEIELLKNLVNEGDSTLSQANSPLPLCLRKQLHANHLRLFHKNSPPPIW